MVIDSLSPNFPAISQLNALDELRETATNPPISPERQRDLAVIGIVKPSVIPIVTNAHFETLHSRLIQQLLSKIVAENFATIESWGGSEGKNAFSHSKEEIPLFPSSSHASFGEMLFKSARWGGLKYLVRLIVGFGRLSDVPVAVFSSTAIQDSEIRWLKGFSPAEKEIFSSIIVLLEVELVDEKSKADIEAFLSAHASTVVPIFFKGLMIQQILLHRGEKISFEVK